MGMKPALYQLMGIRMNSVMNGITNSDGYLLGYSDCKELIANLLSSSAIFSTAI